MHTFFISFFSFQNEISLHALCKIKLTFHKQIICRKNTEFHLQFVFPETNDNENNNKKCVLIKGKLFLQYHIGISCIYTILKSFERIRSE